MESRKYKAMKIGMWCFLLHIILLFIPSGVVVAVENRHQPEETNASCQEDGFCKDGTSDVLQQPNPSLLDPNHDCACTLYVAPSTIPNAGLGVFTSIPLVHGDLVGAGGGDLVLSLQDILHHPRSGLNKLDNALENYNWDLRTVLFNLGVTTTTSATTTSAAAFVPGLESLINSNIALLNVAQADSSVSHVLDPLTMINNGSTPYRNLSTVVIQPIPAGGELFTYYGDDWFSKRDACTFQDIPLSTDLPIAKDLLQDVIQSTVTTSMDNDDDVRQRWIQLLNPFPAIQRKRLLRILPSTVRDLQVALEHGLRAVHQQYAIRSSAELKATGACLDRIVPKPSTLPEGGMGGFAATAMSRDSIITTSPVLHFPNYKASLDHQVWNPLTKRYDTKKPHHRASLPLLVNYCWGHVESTLLLCPYGVGVSYLNHAPTNAHANVRITWSNRTAFPTIGKEWLETDPVSWKQNEATREKPLSAFLDYVATRDIQAGEELLVDYGMEWESAWKSFVLSLQSKHEHDPAFIHALNEQQHIVRTEEEQDEQPYPAGVLLRCHGSILESQQITTVMTEELWSDDHPTTRRGLPCQVLERQIQSMTKEITYAVRVLKPGDRQDQPQWVGRSGIPRAYLRFVEENGDSSDRYFYQPVASTSFRHAMQLPEEMISAAWRNAIKQIV